MVGAAPPTPHQPKDGFRRLCSWRWSRGQSSLAGFSAELWFSFAPSIAPEPAFRMASAVTPSTPDHAAPGSIQSDRLRLARDAHDRAQSLVAVSNKAEAQRWMDRACRLLPSDDTLALAMASGCLGQDDARAAETFARLAARYGSREAWTGLAVSRRNLGDHMGAAEAVSRALSTLVPDETLADVASLVARPIAAPGWCWASVDGALDIHVTYDPGEIGTGNRRTKTAVVARTIDRRQGRLARCVVERRASSRCDRRRPTSAR